MTENIENLVKALRTELEQYGEMLALLEQQQKAIVERSADEVFRSIAPIKAQAVSIQQARAHRELCTSEVAQSLGREAGTTFAELVPLLLSDCRPLIVALVEENNELLVRVRQRVRQNHLRLSRSIELMQGLINSLFPSREPRVYNGRGNTAVRPVVQRWTYEAIG
jgi:flagellar biosynthesis/type III secretory pathway chaperone